MKNGMALLLRGALGRCDAGGDHVGGMRVAEDKSVTRVRGFNAGGNDGTIARITADGWVHEARQPIVREARAGCGGNDASALVARSPAGGSTSILPTRGHTVAGQSVEEDLRQRLQAIGSVPDATRMPSRAEALRRGSDFQAAPVRARCRHRASVTLLNPDSQKETQ